MQWNRLKNRYKGPLDHAIATSESFYWRNADLPKDPMVLELRRTMTSLKSSTEKSGADLLMRRTGRREGTEAADELARRVYQEGMAVRRSASHGALLESSGSRGSSSSQVAGSLAPPPLPERPMQISEEMSALFEKPAPDVVAAENDPRRPTQRKFYKTMESLFVDMDLAHNDMIKDIAPILRCQQVDKMHTWMGNQKEKERVIRHATAPAYMSFTKDSPTLTGSTRPEPHERYYAPLPWAKPGQRPAWMDRGGVSGKARSTPSLFA